MEAFKEGLSQGGELQPAVHPKDFHEFPSLQALNLFTVYRGELVKSTNLRCPLESAAEGWDVPALGFTSIWRPPGLGPEIGFFLQTSWEVFRKRQPCCSMFPLFNTAPPTLPEF